MKGLSNPTQYFKYTFRGYSGYIVAPWIPGVDHDLVTIRHSASVSPWSDRDLHFHRDSEEYYFVFQGALHLLVDGSMFTLRPREVLRVGPGVTHAVVGGRGPIEHFVLRMPGMDDRQTAGQIPETRLPAIGEAERELQRDWGCRAPLAEARNQNCWLFGVGQARFHSDHICLAYLNLPTEESADVHWRSHGHRLHLHRESWEYYTALEGKKVLQVADRLEAVDAGETLAIPAGTKHMTKTVHPPYEGFTFRVPRLDDKVEF